MIKALFLIKQRYFFGFLLAAFLAVFLCNNSFAITTIPKSKYKIVATFQNDNYMTQGGVVTSKYYVFTDCGKANAQQNGGKSHHCTDSDNAVLRVVDRKTCKQTGSAKITSGYLSGIYHEWGSSKITMFGSNKGCMEIKNGTPVKSGGCQSATRLKIGVSTGQGSSAYFNGYYYSVEGTTNQEHPIAVFRGKDKKKMGVWKLAEKLGEPEQISVDGSTGEVFIAYNKGHKTKSDGKITKTSKTFYVKIDASVFKDYTGINKTSSDPICEAVNKPKDTGSNSGGGNSGGDNGGTTHEEPATQEDDDPVPEEDDCATILKGLCEETTNDSEQGIIKILKFVIDMMSTGVIILAAIGIVICGFIIMTARDNEAQAAKAKKCLVEIVIGIILWVLMAFIVNLLLPGGDSLL